MWDIELEHAEYTSQPIIVKKFFDIDKFSFPVF